MFSQSPSSTEKWNSTLKRYEYFDSNGKITGYKKYNNYNAQWEIIDFQKNPESYRGGNSAYSDGPGKRSVPDLEYPSLSASDIEYARAVANTEISKRQKAEIQESNRNLFISVVQEHYDKLSAKINNLNLSNEEKMRFRKEFNDKVAIADATFTHLELPEVANAKMTFLTNIYNELSRKFTSTSTKTLKELIDESNAK